ncbi:MAG TPA: LuxR C-terminal-related transcriptional regulator, partial [Slackia equolifaciens]|nr:LuxR C-terminal-related transcriptional regulator [Slackia equolifaciens]
VVQLLMVALVSVYILLLIYFVSRRKQGVALGRRGQDIESAPDSGALASWLSDADSASMMDSDDEPDEPASIVLSVKDALHDRCSAMTEESGLSAREAEIMEYLALGRSVPYIAEALYISENTVRTHCKSIYRKLGIHSKSELMDLVDNSKTLS